MAINQELFEFIFASTTTMLDSIKGDPSRLLSEADLQSRLFMSLSGAIESRPDHEQIALHSELRFFASPENQKKGIYPDLCILDKDNILLCDSRVYTKGYVLRGSCIQIELKLRRNNLGNASPSRWCKDLKKLAGFRDFWSNSDQESGSTFFPLFVVYSHLLLHETEIETLERQSQHNRIWSLACDSQQIRKITPHLLP
jgi:hypothetical protein